ncbi:DoxX family protein [Ectobacillus funiculus]|uniref:DoxX family protein n=1 Tax=Ectobacillus funiculus TaxID=137993 RepID=A0ABV5WIT8_9BACI
MKWVIRILQGLLAVGFAAFGVMKLTGNAMQVQIFEGFGYPLGFMYFVGFCEVLGAIGLLIGFWKSRIALLASGGLVLLMAGAVFAHFKAGQGIGLAMPALVFFILSLVVLLGKRAGNLSKNV